MTPSLHARGARAGDEAAVADIYNQGIKDRVATFETEPRLPTDITPWLSQTCAFVVVEDEIGRILAWAAAHPYADRCCYRGIGEFSVYVAREARGQGAGAVAMTALIDASRRAGLWKLLSRVFPENHASLALMARMGFKELGVHEKHGKLDGQWRDCVIVERLIPENLD